MGDLGVEHLGAVRARVAKNAGKMLGLDVAAHVGDGLVTTATAQQTLCVQAVPLDVLVEVLHATDA